MESHLLNLVLYAVMVSVGFALFMRDGARDRMRFGARLALCMVAAAIAAGWLMYLAD